VLYPGSPTHPQHDLAKRQMRHGGTLLAVEVEGGRRAVDAMFGALTIARVATSLGGPETLVCHPATSTHASLTAEEAELAGITDGLVRISVGLEDPDDLVADLTAALDAGRA
jgi:cystathionine beta-lyase/cystathionine gamma-synthase